ncbi:MAG: hypothetical protein IJ371_04870 [Clostridia bacterium]|nr:hypothetical protein [Clostridia bacterium]
MDRQQQNNILQGYIKRIGITILCCLPILVLIGFWLQGLNSVATIAIFVLFMLVAIFIEEYIHIKISTKRQLKNKVLHKNEDVFK